MSDIRIDILDASGARIADGPLTTVKTLEDTASLDKIGTASFTMPATDPRAAYIQAGVIFDIFDRVDHFVGRFYYRSKRLDTKAAGGTNLRVECFNQLVELARTNTYFRRAYTATAVEAVVTDLVELADGWVSACDAGIGTTTVGYEGNSVLEALDVLRSRWNRHYRLGDPFTLEFGAFGSDSGLVVGNVRGQEQTAFQANLDFAIAEAVALVEESDDIYNRIIPLGAGLGTSQLHIGDATLGEYAVQVGVNADGSPFYYIEDAASVALYGRRPKPLVFPTIRPITNSDANIVNAANALKLAAEAFLAQHREPVVTYTVQVRALRRAVAVGDLVRLQYRGIVDEIGYVDIDELFYVMDVRRQREDGGARSAALTISTIAARQVDDSELIVSVINDIRALKINVQPTQTYSPVGPYIKRMDHTHSAEFTARVGAEVTYLNYAILRFRTSTLKSSVTGTSAGGGSFGTTDDGGSSTPTSGGSNTTTTGASSNTTSGGSNTTTTGASSNSTSASGGGSTNTSTVSAQHVHDILVRHDSTPGGEGPAVFFNATTQIFQANFGDATNHSQLSEGSGEHTHNITIPAHTHGIDHTHGFNHTHDIPHTHGFNHTHTVNVPAHNHTLSLSAHNHVLAYGIYADTTYPQSISLAINGVDVTSALGGPWAPTNASIEIEVEITDYLVNAVGGLRQNHRLEFTCGSGQGEIEAEIDILATIQAILIS